MNIVANTPKKLYLQSSWRKAKFTWQHWVKLKEGNKLLNMGKLNTCCMSIKKYLVFLTPSAHTQLLSLLDHHNMVTTDSSVTRRAVWFFWSHDRKYEQLSV